MVNGNRVQTLVFKDGSVMTAIIYANKENVVWCNKSFNIIDNKVIIQN